MVTRNFSVCFSSDLNISEVEQLLRSLVGQFDSSAQIEWKSTLHTGHSWFIECDVPPVGYTLVTQEIESKNGGEDLRFFALPAGAPPVIMGGTPYFRHRVFALH